MNSRPFTSLLTAGIVAACTVLSAAECFSQSDGSNVRAAQQSRQITAQAAQEIHPYHSQEIQPYHAPDVGPAQRARQAQVDRAANQEAGGCGQTAAPYSGPGNLVEPLSDGLQLSMTDAQIRRALGNPEPSWDSRTYSYPGIDIQVGGAEKEIWDVVLKTNCVKLHSGIGPGSPRAQVRSVFGKTDQIVYGPYKLMFAYRGDMVSSVHIEPASGSFRAAAKPGHLPDSASQTAKLAPAETRSPHENSASDGLAGDWYCVSPNATVGTIKMDGRGHYTFGANSGRYTVAGNGIAFSGIPWNGGHAQLVKGNLEFYYSDAQGNKYYFAFARY